MKIVFNGKIIEAKEGDGLKEILQNAGVNFPCGGTGRCGKCRITCPDLAPTKLDERFLTEEQIESGIRLACDKRLERDLTVRYDGETVSARTRDLDACRIACSIGYDRIEIGIMDDTIAEKVVIENPLLACGSLSELNEAYLRDGDRITKLLRAALGKESIELFEKYDKAKAETFAIATNGIYAHILLGLPLDEAVPDYNAIADPGKMSLPAETVYFLPIINDYLGGDVLAETVNYPDNTILIDCEDILTIISMGEEDNCAAVMWDVDYDDEVSKKAIAAAIKTILPDEKTPFVRLYGEYKEEVIELLPSILSYSENDKDLSNVAKACLMLRFRAKLNKEKARTSVLNLLNSEKFHDFLAGSGNV